MRTQSHVYCKKGDYNPLTQQETDVESSTHQNLETQKHVQNNHLTGDNTITKQRGTNWLNEVSVPSLEK